MSSCVIFFSFLWTVASGFTAPGSHRPAPIAPLRTTVAHTFPTMLEVLPDMSPNSLLFVQDHGPALNFFAGGNLQTLWEATFPHAEMRQCCPALNYMTGGNLMALWAAVQMETARMNPVRVCTGRPLARTRTGSPVVAAISMSPQAADACPIDFNFFSGGDLRCLFNQCMATTRMRMSMSSHAPDECPIDFNFFSGGDLRCLFNQCMASARMRMPKRMQTTPRMAAMSMSPQASDACPIDYNFFSGGDLRCLFNQCMATARMRMPKRMQTMPLNFFAGGDLLALWKSARC